MIRKTLLTGLGLGMAFAMTAAPISPEQALQRATAGGPAKARGLVNRTSLVHTARHGDMASAYVFQNSGGGYVILSADDVAYPVLGYSDSGTFDAGNMPPQMEWWLSQYGEQMKAAAKSAPLNDNPTNVCDPSWTAIAPLVKTQWNQGAPYNGECPVIASGQCFTGCVATSMAQVMNYFQYPEVGRGEKRYENATVGKLYIDFGARGFDWENMLDTYLPGRYDEVEAAAVAYLMKACGYSVSMGYHTTQSGAVSTTIPKALVEYFNYDPGVSYKLRVDYSTTEWTKMVYDNLKNIGPLIYDGTDPGNGGHSFVCDGYDGNGYFHFNWGWSGMSDGYFSLNALNPEALGTGGGTGGGFNNGQGVCFGIQKPTGQAVTPQERTIDIEGGIFAQSLSGKVLRLGLRGYENAMWVNNTTEDITVAVGVIIEPVNGGKAQYVKGTFNGASAMTLPSGNFWTYHEGASKTRPIIVSLPADLAEGNYKVTAAVQDTGSGSDTWVPVNAPYGYPNYITIEKKNGTLNATSIDYPKLGATGIELLRPLYYSRTVSLETELTNDTQYEVTQALSLVLLSGKDIRFKGDARVLFNVLPGKKVKASWDTTLTRVSGSGNINKDTEFTIGLYNETTGELLGTFGEVTMKPNPGNPKISMQAFSLLDTEKGEVEIEGENRVVYLVEDPSDMKVNYAFKVTSGYFDSPLSLGIGQLVPGSGGSFSPLQASLYSEQYFLGQGDSVNETVTLSFPEANEGDVYCIYGEYKVGSNIYRLPSLPFIYKDNSGVDNVLDEDESAVVEYYNLQGVKIANPQNGEIVIERKGQKVTKKIFRN